MSPIDDMRLSLGALWPEGRSSSSVSQFLPTRFWSACPMAVRWKDGYRGDLSPWLFLQLCLCSVRCHMHVCILPQTHTHKLSARRAFHKHCGFRHACHSKEIWFGQFNRRGLWYIIERGLQITHVHPRIPSDCWLVYLLNIFLCFLYFCMI